MNILAAPVFDEKEFRKGFEELEALHTLSHQGMTEIIITSAKELSQDERKKFAAQLKRHSPNGLPPRDRPHDRPPHD